MCKSTDWDPKKQIQQHKLTLSATGPTKSFDPNSDGSTPAPVLRARVSGRRIAPLAWRGTDNIVTWMGNYAQRRRYIVREFGIGELAVGRKFKTFEPRVGAQKNCCTSTDDWATKGPLPGPSETQGPGPANRHGLRGPRFPTTFPTEAPPTPPTRPEQAHGGVGRSQLLGLVAALSGRARVGGSLLDAVHWSARRVSAVCTLPSRGCHSDRIRLGAVLSRGRKFESAKLPVTLP
jgi:hypothetical protein